MNLYDIVTLDNNKEYVICKTLTYKEKEYLLLIRVDEDENLLDERLIVEKLNNGKTLKKIKESNLKQIISEKFAKMIIEELKV